MSYEAMVRSLRDDLVAGARKRRRFERRRAAALAATPVVLVLAIVGALLAGRYDQGASDVRTEPGVSADVLAACGLLLDLYDASAPADTALMERIAAELIAMGPVAEDDLGQLPTVLPEATAPTGETPAHQAMEQCRQIGAPGWVSTFVLPELGPDPLVELDAYGIVRGWHPIDTTDLPTVLANIAGEDLSLVRVARSDDGYFVAEWDRQTLSGARRYCQARGDETTFLTCASTPPRWLDVSESMPAAFRLEAGEVLAAVNDRVSFVTLAAAGPTVVMRPVLGVVVLPAVASDAVARAYAADGTQIACAAWGAATC